MANCRRKTWCHKQKLEVHNVSQRHQRRTKPRPYATCCCTNYLVKIARVVPEMSSQTGRHTHTHRRTQHNTSQPLKGAKQIWFQYHLYSTRNIPAINWCYLERYSDEGCFSHSTNASRHWQLWYAISQRRHQTFLTWSSKTNSVMAEISAQVYY